MPLLDVPSWVSGGFSLANNGETPGAPGPMGPQGPMGPSGNNGLDGGTGPMGPQGPMGLLSIGTWVDIVPSTGFAVGTPKPQYRKFGDAVQFRGRLKTVTLLALGTPRTVLTMPTGMRPSHLAQGESMRSMVMNTAANTLCYVAVNSAGLVSAASVAALSINDEIDLNGFTYQTS